MSKPRLAQIDPEAATSGQVPTYNPSSGEYEPQTPAAASLFTDRTLSSSLTVPADKTFITHDLLIANGSELLILDTGEALYI